MKLRQARKLVQRRIWALPVRADTWAKANHRFSRAPLKGFFKLRPANGIKMKKGVKAYLRHVQRQIEKEMSGKTAAQLWAEVF